MNNVQQVGFTFCLDGKFAYFFQKYGWNITADRGDIMIEAECKVRCSFEWFQKNKFNQNNIVPVFVLFEGFCPENKKIIGYTISFDDFTFPTKDYEYNAWHNNSRFKPDKFEPLHLVEEQAKTIINRIPQIVPVLVNK